MTVLTILHLLDEVVTFTPSVRAAHVLEGKMAGLLADLILAGTSSRTVLVGLLWPEVMKAAAQAHLRQMLRHLCKARSAVVVGEQLLALVNVEVDVQQLELAVFTEEDKQVVDFGGTLPPTYDDADCPNFMDWQRLERGCLSQLRVESYTRLIRVTEEQADLRLALKHTLRLPELDPLSEAAYRRLMRLHVLPGDRYAALQIFRQCRKVLHRKLNVLGLPKTQTLAAQIEQGQEMTALFAAFSTLPQRIHHPLLLVDHERERDELQAARNSGQTIPVVGPAGIRTKLRCNGELPSEPLQDLQRAAEQRTLHPMFLDPLQQRSVKVRPENLDRPHTSDMAYTPTWHTDGNPLFILETLRSLLQTGSLNSSLLKDQGFTHDLLEEVNLQHIPAVLMKAVFDQLAADTPDAVSAEMLSQRFWIELRLRHPVEAEDAIIQAIRLTPNLSWLDNKPALLYWHTGCFLGCSPQVRKAAGRGTRPWRIRTDPQRAGQCPVCLRGRQRAIVQRILPVSLVPMKSR